MLALKSVAQRNTCAPGDTGAKVSTKRSTLVLKTLAYLILSFLPAPMHHAHAGPGLHLRWRLGWLRGLTYRVLHWFRLPDRPRVKFGRRLSIQGRLRMRGP